MKNNTQIYMAPLEGITKYIYRNSQKEIFGGITKYFAPFIDGRIQRPLKSREMNDLLPENNSNLFIVPQIMGNQAPGFLATAKQLYELGYQEVNLNLGCPSMTVVRKGKGAGFLGHYDKLNEFLFAIFNDPLFHSHSMKLSIKTRLGLNDATEIQPLLSLFNYYSLTELIVHPRLQSDYYKNDVNLNAFSYIVNHSTNPIVYNGDLNTIEDILKLQHQFIHTNTIMIGRGLLRNPALARELFGGKAITQEEFVAFHNQILAGYEELLSGETPVLHKMKELWVYWSSLFENEQKQIKALKKSQHITDYLLQVNTLIHRHWKG